jgi:hypothetical protein
MDGLIPIDGSHVPLPTGSLARPRSSCTNAMRCWPSISHHTRLLSQGLGGLFEHLPFVDKEAFQRIAQVAEEMKAIGNLGSLRGSPRSTIGIATTPVARNRFNRWMRPEPRGDRIWRPVWEQVDRLMSLQVHTQRTVIPPFLPRPLVEADDARCWK